VPIDSRKALSSEVLRGVPVCEWRTALRDACRKANVPHQLLHDCRRTAARNLIRAGVPERIAARTFPAGSSRSRNMRASDGRFLMNVTVEGATAPPITVVLNWAAALKR